MSEKELPHCDLEICQNCQHCLPSFTLYYCDAHGKLVAAQEWCELFYPKDDELQKKIEKWYEKHWSNP